LDTDPHQSTIVVAGLVVGGASGTGELAWVAGAVVTGAVVVGVWADAGWVDAAWLDDGDEPQPAKLPARLAVATMAIAIGDFLMPHPLVCPARDEPVEGVIVLRSTRASGEIQPSCPRWR
jgi:hypothetical protein